MKKIEREREKIKKERTLRYLSKWKKKIIYFLILDLVRGGKTGWAQRAGLPKLFFVPD